MSKILLDGFDIVSGLQAVYGIGVAQIVKTEACQTDTGHDFLEVHVRKTEMTFVIQSPFGGEITPEEIRARIGEVDAVYIRVDQNKAYWVKGDENGDIDLW
jgi:hypothetical protein